MELVMLRSKEAVSVMAMKGCIAILSWIASTNCKIAASELSIYVNEYVKGPCCRLYHLFPHSSHLVHTEDSKVSDTLLYRPSSLGLLSRSLVG